MGETGSGAEEEPETETQTTGSEDPADPDGSLDDPPPPASSATPAGSPPAKVTGSGLVVSAPQGMLVSSPALDISIDEIREAFGESLPGNGVVLGAGHSVTVAQDGSTASNSEFAKNFNVTIPVTQGLLDENPDMGVVIRLRDGDDEEVRVVTNAALQVFEDPTGANSSVSFKAGGAEIDVQLYASGASVYQQHEIFVARPRDPIGVSASAASTSSILVQWGNPGGTVAAYRVTHGTDEATVAADLGCQGSASSGDIPGNQTSYELTGLIPATTYHVRVCSLNARSPQSDTSPGKTASARTADPTVPVVHVLYSYNENPSSIRVLRHGVNAGSSWAIDTATSVNDFVNSGASFSLDEQNVPHVGYLHTVSGSVEYHARYIRKVAGIWTDESLLSLTIIDSLASISLAVDDGGIPSAAMLTYDAGSEESIARVYRRTGSWVATNSGLGPNSTETVPDELGSDSLAIDSNENRHLVFSKTGGSGPVFSYAFESGGVWQTTESISDSASCPVTFNGNLVIDDNDKIHTAYLCLTTGSECAIEYATNATGSWVRTRLPNLAGNAACTSAHFVTTPGIAADDDGKIYITYVSRLDGKIHLVSNKTGSFVDDVVTTADLDVYQPPKVAVDFDDNVHLLFAENDKDVRYASRVGGTWTVETIQTGDNFVQLHGIEVEGMLSRSSR